MARPSPAPPRDMFSPSGLVDAKGQPYPRKPWNPPPPPPLQHPTTTVGVDIPPLLFFIFGLWVVGLILYTTFLNKPAEPAPCLHSCTIHQLSK